MHTPKGGGFDFRAHTEAEDFTPGQGMVKRKQIDVSLSRLPLFLPLSHPFFLSLSCLKSIKTYLKREFKKKNLELSSC